jgi:hypothetical protein
MQIQRPTSTLKQLACPSWKRNTGNSIVYTDKMSKASSACGKCMIKIIAQSAGFGRYCVTITEYLRLSN